MKITPLSFLLLLISLYLNPQPSRADIVDVRLNGIINLPEFKAALLEYNDTDFRSKQREHVILREAQRLQNLEVIQIDPKTSTAKLKVNQTNLVVTLAQAKRPLEGFQVDKGNFDELVRLYGQFTGRNVLRPQVFLETPFTLNAYATNKMEAAAALAKAFENKGLAVIPDGEKFVMIVPKEKASMAIPRSSQIKSSKPISTEAPSTNIIPAGEIYFAPTFPDQVAKIYAELMGRKLEQNDLNLGAKELIYFRSETPLSKEELAYAIETLFSWQNIKFVPVGDNLIKAVQITPQEK